MSRLLTFKSHLVLIIVQFYVEMYTTGTDSLKCFGERGFLVKPTGIHNSTISRPYVLRDLF